MSQEALEFIRILESREDWSFKDDMLERARALSTLILTDVKSSNQVPTDVWLQFLALLPYSDALNALSDLSLVLPNIVKNIVETSSTDEPIIAAKTIIVERLKQLVRKKLHDDVLTARRRTSINIALSSLSKRML